MVALWGMAINKQMNFRPAPEIVKMIEALRRVRTPIPKASQILQEAVREKYARDLKKVAPTKE